MTCYCYSRASKASISNFLSCLFACLPIINCGSVQCWQRTDAGFFFLMASLHRIPASEDAFYEHIRCILVHIMFFTTMLVLSCVFLAFLCTLSEHTHNAHNQSTPSRCCEQLSLHFPQKRRNGSGNGEGSTSFKSAMFSTSSLCRSTPICQRRPPLAVHSRRHFERRHVLIHRIRLKKYANKRPSI